MADAQSVTRERQSSRNPKPLARLPCRFRAQITGKKGAHHDNIMMSKQGTSRPYTLERLKNERPDLFERVKAKQLSANAAATPLSRGGPIQGELIKRANLRRLGNLPGRIAWVMNELAG